MSRIESAIRIVAETQGQLRERLDGVEQQAQRAQSQQTHARSDRADAQARLGEAALRSDELAAQGAAHADAMPAPEGRAPLATRVSYFKGPRDRWLTLAATLAERGRGVEVLVGPVEIERDDPRRWAWPVGVSFVAEAELVAGGRGVDGGAGLRGADSGPRASAGQHGGCAAAGSVCL